MFYVQGIKQPIRLNMGSLELIMGSVHSTTATAPSTSRRHKTNGRATAALLIQIASEILETSPILRKRLGVTLTDLAAADKVRKGLVSKSTLVS